MLEFDRYTSSFDTSNIMEHQIKSLIESNNTHTIILGPPYETLSFTQSE